MNRFRMMFGVAALLTLIAVSVSACGNYDNYRASHPQQSILAGPDRTNDWWKTNDDGK